MNRARIDRRTFLCAGTTLAAGSSWACTQDMPGPEAGALRERFPRAETETFLNAAGGMPLSRFSEAGLTRYMDFIRLGPGGGRGDYFNQMWSDIRGNFARLISAAEEEISLVHCTKAGEQFVMDGLPALRTGGNIVSNDFHFSGSLHNLVGMSQSGFDVRIVKSDGRDVPIEAMLDVIDERTALVSITLLSNVNGRIEAVRGLADAVHDVGGYLYADIIQAAGIYPIDVAELGIDFAACSAYKWLHGVHGTGFMYVREGLETEALDHVRFPGNARHNYSPWTQTPDTGHGDFVFAAREDGRRYEPGHVSYLGYCAAYEGMKFIREEGVETLLAYSARLAKRVSDGLDETRYECTTPNPGETPIVAFRFDPTMDLETRLRENGIVIALGRGSMRISPAIFNTDDDIDHLVSVLNA